MVFMNLASGHETSATEGDRGNGRLFPLALPGVLVALFLLAASICLQAGDRKNLLEFASEMARSGNWREARFRWERALDEDQSNPHIINNLAVATEALGDESKARDLYERALVLAPGDPVIADNLSRHRRFWKVERSGEASADPPAAAWQVSNPGNRKSKKGKTFRVETYLPLPSRLDVSDMDSLLVASFLTLESDLLDTNRELVRYLRAEFRKKSALEVRQVTPPPAVPEQRLEDLIANAEFWRHLGREHDADLIVSGRIVYDRRDASGFQEVDYVSPTTGQKVRQTRFVEQEEFEYRMVILFFDGRTGELLFRDQLKRSIFFRGLNNDPITAFYELADTLAEDVLSVVNPRRKLQFRTIFRG
jgi:hypothetical protein